MAKHRFVATHGVHLSEDGTDGTTWAHFTRDSSLDTAEGGRRYVFETDDAAVAGRVRKVKDYGITEDKSSDKPDDEK